MKYKFFFRGIIFLILVSCLTNLVSCVTKTKNLKFNDYSKLKKEFDICPWWFDGMTWDDFQKIKAKLKRKELIKYVNKIELNRSLKEKDIPVIRVYYSSYTKSNIKELLKKYPSYVAKATHMSQNHGNYIVKDGVNLWNGSKVTPEYINKKMNELIHTPSNSNEWVLQKMRKGFLIQELIEDRQELKLQTIWGKVIEVKWLDNKAMKMKYHSYDTNGKALGDSSSFPYPELWSEATELAEKIADKTDALRVDLMIKFNSGGKPELLVNELELRSQLGYHYSKKFARLLNDGYRFNCIPLASNE